MEHNGRTDVLSTRKSQGEISPKSDIQKIVCDVQLPVELLAEIVGEILGKTDK
jgi:hypothetical protein